MGEALVAFRDTSGSGRVGLLAERCPHRRASLFFGRNEEDGPALHLHGWKFDVDGQCVDMPSEPERDDAARAEDHGEGGRLMRPPPTLTVSSPCPGGTICRCRTTP